MNPFKSPTAATPQRRPLAPPAPTDKSPVARDVLKPVAPVPAPEAKAAAQTRPRRAAAALLVLFAWLLGLSAATAQFTTNRPAIITNVASSYTTNAPVAVWVASTNWPPAPSFTNWTGIATNAGESFRISGVTWVAPASPVTTGGVIQVWQASNSVWYLRQELARNGSITNGVIAGSNQTFYGDVALRLRYRQGPYVSPFSAAKTNLNFIP